MLYHWKEPRIWGIGIPGEVIEPGRMESGLVTFLPGVHEMDNEDWEKIKKCPNYPDVQERIESGILQVEIEEEIKEKSGQATKKDDKGWPKHLDNFKPMDANEFVTGVFEKDVLTGWLRKEKRPTVVKKIKEQIKAVEFAEKPKGQEE